jgi:hypothetical protein
MNKIVIAILIGIAIAAGAVIRNDPYKKHMADIQTKCHNDDNCVTNALLGEKMRQY